MKHIFRPKHVERVIFFFYKKYISIESNDNGKWVDWITSFVKKFEKLIKMLYRDSIELLDILVEFY